MWMGGLRPKSRCAAMQDRGVNAAFASAFGDHCHPLTSFRANLRSFVSPARRGDTYSLVFGSKGHLSPCLGNSFSPAAHLCLDPAIAPAGLRQSVDQ